jgi:hypothetical protein
MHGSASRGRAKATDAGRWRRSASSPTDCGSGAATASGRAARTRSNPAVSRPRSHAASVDPFFSLMGHLTKEQGIHAVP